MKSITLFLLPLFLLLPAATQCMEKEIVFQPKTMQDIRNERHRIHQNIFHHERSMQLDSEYIKNSQYTPYYAVLCRFAFEDKYPKIENLRYDNPYLATFRLEECSCLGLAIIAIQRPHFVSDHDKWGQEHNYHLMQNPKQAPFKERKEAVQLYRKIKLLPTSKDKYLALLTKCDEFVPTIIKKKLVIPHLLALLEINMPQEIIDYISLLMFNAEESLL